MNDPRFEPVDSDVRRFCLAVALATFAFITIHPLALWAFAK